MRSNQKFAGRNIAAGLSSALVGKLLGNSVRSVQRRDPLVSDADTTLAQLKELVARFRDERDWSKFHNPKDLAVSISIEAGELLELFQWKTQAEAAQSAGYVDRAYSWRSAPTIRWAGTKTVPIWAAIGCFELTWPVSAKREKPYNPCEKRGYRGQPSSVHYLNTWFLRICRRASPQNISGRRHLSASTGQATCLAGGSFAMNFQNADRH